MDSSKNIFFNKSTLLSLKAELLKKQEEIYEKKQMPQHRIENFKPPLSRKTVTDGLPPDNGKKTFKDSLKATDVEEMEACKKSKAILEKKAELYDHLSDTAGNSKLSSHFLVDFRVKKQKEVQACDVCPIPEEVETNRIYLDDDSEWTEFTDCLGRTRKCLKTDLEVYQQKDNELLLTLNKNLINSEVNDKGKEDKQSEKPILVQKTNDYLKSLREKWEEKEKELLAKDNDIHYQDLLFDEARVHGVAYYSFSTDEAERQKQMEELQKQREETLRAQKEAEGLRKRREEILAARVAAARARQRARAGLPPEDPQENQKDFTTCLLEFLTQQKDEANAKAKEMENRANEEKEKERQKLREAYIREWDLGKDGVESKVKRFKQLTQEEYVERERAKRMDEFAPPETSRSDKNNTFDNKGKFVQENIPGSSKSWADVRPNVTSDIPLDIVEPFEKKGLYFSTREKSEFFSKSSRNLKYANFVRAEDSTPINDKLGAECMDDQRLKSNTPSCNHIEIAPPATYDYYGPNLKKSRVERPFESNITEAYEQGAKSLQSKGSKRKLPEQYDFTFI